jgi:ribosomal protein S18 acetylase RimI-like enzyme
MGELLDKAMIRRLLEADRAWAVYALGDLSPENFVKARWFGPGLALVYRDFDACILFAMDPGGVAEALTHVAWPVHLQLRARELAEVERRAVVTRRTPMWRMVWSGDRSGWVEHGETRRLGAADVPAIERLYATGAATGESPDFFFPAMVEAGVFFGVFEGGELLAAAGTHLYAPGEGAAAIGNVYTRPEARGRGLGRQVTCAVTRALAGLPTVGLNVKADNAAAIRVYESLGFRKHCPFFEGLAAGPTTGMTG